MTGICSSSARGETARELFDTDGAAAPETQAAIREILLIARVDMGVLLLVVADMVMKPFSWKAELTCDLLVT